MRKADPVDAGRIERITGAGAHAALVEQVGGLRVGVLIEERVDLSAHIKAANRSPLRRAVTINRVYPLI